MVPNPRNTRGSSRRRNSLHPHTSQEKEASHRNPANHTRTRAHNHPRSVSTSSSIIRRPHQLSPSNFQDLSSTSSKTRTKLIEDWQTPSHHRIERQRFLILLIILVSATLLGSDLSTKVAVQPVSSSLLQQKT